LYNKVILEPAIFGSIYASILTKQCVLIHQHNLKYLREKK